MGEGDITRFAREQLLSQNGAEVISVDDVPAAAAALNAYDASRNLLANCPAAQG